MDEKSNEPLGFESEDPGQEDVTEQIPLVLEEELGDPASGAGPASAEYEGDEQLGRTEEIEGPAEADGEDDVFVILTDGEGADIPIVETEVVDEAGSELGDDLGVGTEKVPEDSGARAEDVGLLSSNPLEPGIEVRDDGGEWLAPTSSMDHDPGAPEVELPDDLEEPLLSVARHEGEEQPEGFGLAEDDEILRARVGGAGGRRAPLVLGIVGLAAAALIGVGYWGFEAGWFPSLTGGAEPRVAVALGQAGTPGSQGSGSEPVEPAPTGVPVVVEPTGGEVQPPPRQQVARETFRHKVRLAIQLGFVGSDGEERK